MVQTRAQAAAVKRERNSEDQDDVPTPKHQRPTTRQESAAEGPPIQGGSSRKRAVQDVRRLVGSESSPKRRQMSRPPAPPPGNSTPEMAAPDGTDCNNPIAVPDSTDSNSPIAVPDGTDSNNPIAVLDSTDSDSLMAAPDRTDSNKLIEFWTREGRWPRQLVDPKMEHVLARKPLPSERPDFTSYETRSDQKPREQKSGQYRDARYEMLLATKGAFMVESEDGIAEDSKQLCRSLLDGAQDVPRGTIFDGDVFKRAHSHLQSKNEARVIQDISRLLVPSAETLALHDERLRILTESVNEGWNNCVPLTGTRPQPDYSVGFRREAFSHRQLAELAPYVGDYIDGDLSVFMATNYMYFPFLACEAKCGAAALVVADRQNAHSMILAARGVVELLRLVNREMEVHRQFLSFSVSHDDEYVRIYGYYPVINGKDIKYYRDTIHGFSIKVLDGKEKWTAYRFTKNVYDTWVPDHFKRIRSAIDQLPSKVVQSISATTGLSRNLRGQLALPEADSESSAAAKDDNQSGKFGPVAAPDSSRFLMPAPPKKQKKNPVRKL